MEQGSTSLSTSACNGYGLQPKHKVFLSHSGAQKGFVEQLCVDLERCDHPPFFDKCRDCLPIGKDFPRLTFEAIKQCEVGVVVLSEEFFTSKWPMLELVAMTNVKKRKPNFTIMPILLGLSLSQCHDVNNHKRWLSLWHIWAECDSRIDLTDWVNVLRLFGPTNALKYNSELGEVKFREEIVEAICRLVPLGTRLEDSHIQGRSRLCKVIHERIKQSKVSLLYGVHVIGLHGFGGIDKTTLCKAMCNDLFEECRGKVAHMELGSKSEEELLKEVLRRLTDMNLQHLGAMDVDEYHYHLMQDMMNVKVFLTIDNVSSATRMQALTLLRANYGHGSIVLVTARSLSELMSLRILASECMEMPELEMEEARSLFLYHAACVPSTYSSNEDDHELVLSCVQQCYFKKGDGNSYHYHPLALQTLGEQLGCKGYVPEQWWSQLHEIDFLNLFGEPQHPVFSILRISFDALNLQEQLLFMDAAIFGPHIDPSFKCNVFEWFGIVHGIPMKIVIERLENLKRKSLLENLGNGFSTIDMHDLWREFAKLETKAGKFEKRRWMFEWDEHYVFEEASVTNGGRSVDVRRMFFMDNGFMKLEDLSFFCFPSVTALKLSPNFPGVQELDLRGLKHLKSLELEFIWDSRIRKQTLISVVGLDSLLKLGFLRWLNIPSGSPCIDEINRLTNLQVLDLYGRGRVPDLSNLILLQVASFRLNDSVATITGFSSNHTNLQILDLSFCRALKSCPGVGELVALQELRLWCCFRLKEVPNLQKLKRLRKLEVGSCSSLRGLPGFGDLVSLLKLNACCCLSLAELPDMRNLRNLRILDLGSCKLIKSLPGLNELVSLRSLYTSGCENLTQLPEMLKLTNLQNLQLDPDCLLQSFVGLSDLISLESLHVGIDEVHDGLDLRKLTMLKSLHIAGWQGQGFPSLAELVSLESAIVRNCKGVRVLPDLERLSRLGELELRRCEFEDMSSLSHLTSLHTLKIKDCEKLEALPDLTSLQESTIWDCNKLEALPDLRELKHLEIKRCAWLRDVHGILGFWNLKRLRSSGDPRLHENLGLDLPQPMTLPVLLVSGSGFTNQQGPAAYSELLMLVCKGCPIQELPNLAHFPKLSYLNVKDCVNLTKLTCTGPLSSALCHLNVRGCMSLQALPDLTNSRKMIILNVANSGVVWSAQLTEDMKARWPSMELITKDDDIDLITEDDDDDIDMITDDKDEDDDDDTYLITEDDDEDENIDLMTGT